MIREISALVREKIQKYADKKGISYDEAAKRAFLVVDGKKIDPINKDSLVVAHDSLDPFSLGVSEYPLIELGIQRKNKESKK
jgi:hypothetical protein